MSAGSLRVGDAVLKYHVVGTGDPVVFLHCTGGSGRQWTEFAEALRAKFLVIAPDLCGYGDTTHWGGAGTFNLAVEADLIAALVGELKTPAHIVGHSYGGAVALQLALRHPRHLKSLTLIEPAAFHLLRGGDEIDERALMRISEVAATIANAVNCGDYFGAMRRFVDYWNGEGAWNALPGPQRIALVSKIGKITLDFWATLNDPVRPRDLFEVLAPTLIISGGRSPLTPRRICSHLVRGIPDAKLRTIAAAGHMLPLTHLDEVLPLIVNHWDVERQHDSTRRGEVETRAVA